MSFLEFSSVLSLSDAVVSPLQLSSGVVINNFSLANNDLSDANIKTFVKQWRIDKPTLRDITVDPGNPLITDVGRRLLNNWHTAGSDVTTSSDDSSPESDASPESDTSQPSPVMTKPPLPPRKLSFQSTVSARSDKLETDSDKAGSEKADLEKTDSDTDDSDSVKADLEKADSESDFGFEDYTEKEKFQKIESRKSDSEDAKSDASASTSKSSNAGKYVSHVILCYAAE